VSAGSKAAFSARAAADHMVKVEIEVDTLEHLAEALSFDIDAVLLDNMGPEERSRRRPGHHRRS
jgi:nicotinate-nucleotide pyrophosphorylase